MPGNITPDDRTKYILEPFRVLNPELEECYNNMTRFDKPCGLGCIGTAVVPAVLLAIVLYLQDRPDLQEKVLTVAYITFAVGTAYTLLQLVLVPGRHLRTRVMPKLVELLRPLHPTRAELTSALEKCNAAGMIIAKK